MRVWWGGAQQQQQQACRVCGLWIVDSGIRGEHVASPVLHPTRGVHEQEYCIRLTRVCRPDVWRLKLAGRAGGRAGGMRADGTEREGGEGEDDDSRPPLRASAPVANAGDALLP